MIIVALQAGADKNTIKLFADHVCCPLGWQEMAMEVWRRESAELRAQLEAAQAHVVEAEAQRVRDRAQFDDWRPVEGR